MNVFNPLVSIIIPTYNRAHLILEALHSVQNQTYSNWECIVVDDGSSDDTIKVVKQIIRTEKRLSILKNNRKKGAQGARNTGVLTAKGDYFIFLDSDDLLSIDCLEKRVAKFKEYRDFDFLAFSTLEFKKDLNDKGILVNVTIDQNPILRFFNLDVPWLIMGVIWKKESFLRLGKWDEDILSWQDWEMHVRALLNNYSFIHFSIVDNYWRNDGNIKSIGKESLSLEHLQSHLKLCESIKKEVLNNPVYLGKLNRLIFWLGEKALERGYFKFAIKAVDASHHNLNPIKGLINKFGVIFFKRYLIYLRPSPDFGLMRKVKYRII